MLSEAEKLALRDLRLVADRLGFPLMLVGAGARVLTIDRSSGIAGRSTTDWDWGLKVSSWAEFDQFVAALTQGNPASFQRATAIHRFTHVLTGTIIDIVPFGPVAPSQELTWPNHADRTMNVLGYEDALLQAQELRLDLNLDFSVKVVSVPALLVLKLIAWSDRGGHKDLDDIDFILKHHFDPNLYTELGSEIATGVVDIETAPQFYLGREIRNSFGPTAVAETHRLLGDIIARADQLIPRLIPRSARDWDLAFDDSLSRFRAVQQGLTR